MGEDEDESPRGSQRNRKGTCGIVRGKTEGRRVCLRRRYYFGSVSLRKCFRLRRPMIS